MYDIHNASNQGVQHTLVQSSLHSKRSVYTSTQIQNNIVQQNNTV